MANLNFKPFPILTTERLTLRQLKVVDSNGIFDLRSNTTINKYLDRNPSKKLADALIFIQNILENSESDALFYWAITKTSEDQLIGTVCLFDFEDDVKKCEIGYELLTEYQGNGIMIEAVKKVIEYATKNLGVKIIDASVHKENQSSIKLLQKIDFKPMEDGTIENATMSLFRLEKH